MSSPTLNILAFATLSQVALYEMELIGQISDGHWENARPDGHWEPWCIDIQVIVDPENVGRDFYADKVNYNLTNKDLLEVVGTRMERYVRLALHFGLEQAKVLEDALDLYGDFRGLPAASLDGDYWDGIRAKLAPFDMAEVKRVVEDESTYGRKELMADLRAMKAAMRTIRNEFRII